MTCTAQDHIQNTSIGCLPRRYHWRRTGQPNAKRRNMAREPSKSEKVRVRVRVLLQGFSKHCLSIKVSNFCDNSYGGRRCNLCTGNTPEGAPVLPQLRNKNTEAPTIIAAPTSRVTVWAYGRWQRAPARCSPSTPRPAPALLHPRCCYLFARHC